MAVEMLGGLTKFEVGCPLPDVLGIDSSQPSVFVDAHSRLVILNHVGPEFSREEIRGYRDDLSIGVYQRRSLLVAMVSGRLGGDSLVLPCGCGECSEPHSRGSHLVWAVLLAHSGTVRDMRAATTDEHFSRVWHRSNLAAAEALALTGIYPVDALLDLRASHRTRSSMWRAADARSRFGE